MLMLNCDWFQPFKHTQFSVGVLYFAIENLPRDIRFERENILVVGIIPGPSEPKMCINTYLKPIIDDLQKLWRGVVVNIKGHQFVLHYLVLLVMFLLLEKLGDLLAIMGSMVVVSVPKNSQQKILVIILTIQDLRKQIGNPVIMDYMFGMLENKKLQQQNHRERVWSHCMELATLRSMSYLTTIMHS